MGGGGSWLVAFCAFPGFGQNYPQIFNKNTPPLYPKDVGLPGYDYTPTSRPLSGGVTVLQILGPLTTALFQTERHCARLMARGASDTRRAIILPSSYPPCSKEMYCTKERLIRRAFAEKYGGESVEWWRRIFLLQMGC